MKSDDWNILVSLVKMHSAVTQAAAHC